MNISIFNPNQKGSTLLEAVIAIALLTIGIVTVMTMQTRAISASSSAMNRTEANNVALALLETLKELPFDDANLNPTPPVPGTPVNDANARPLTAAILPTLPMLASLQVGANAGEVVDQSGITYQLSWAVQDSFLDPAQTKTLNKSIRVFMSWNTPMGRNQLEMTTIKYNNVKL